MAVLTETATSSFGSRPSRTGGKITASKHHGLGNDFLIALAPWRALHATDAIAWCDRRRGIGADGLIMAEPLAPDLWGMTMWNSDGSQPEVSGNGLRCLGQALAMNAGAGQDSHFDVRTEAGIRSLDVAKDRRSDQAKVRVDMGPATPLAQVSERWADLGIVVERQAGVGIGNPHLVALVDEAASYDPRVFGPVLEADYPNGVNIELIDIPDPANIRFVVWERGAGMTQACGTGACAAAWAARQWGLVEPEVQVHMPGGSATIEVVDRAESEGGPTVFLTAPSVYVGTVILDG